MIVDATVGVDAIVQALARIGATVSWAAEAKPASSVVIGDAEVDDDDACEALPSSYFTHNEEEVEHAEARDVHDFVQACAAGDRMMALALAPRLFKLDSNQRAAERCLFDARCAS